MPANIEVADDGRAAFVSGRGEPGWHMLGTTVDGLMTQDEVMDKSHLAGWNVRLEDLRHRHGNKSLTVEGLHAVVRDNPFTGEPEALAVVGDKYKTHQNEDVFEFAENVISLGGAKWDTAGSLDGGRRVFGTMLVPQSFILDSQGAADRVNTYLGVATSHDGTMPITSFMTGVRVVCQNTLTAALHGNQRVYKVRHTKNAEGRLEDARQALRVAHGYFGELEQEAHALYEAACTNKQFDNIVRTFVGVPDERVSDGKVINQAAITRATNTTDLIHDLYREAGTLDGIRGTGWGAWQALVEFQDWYRPVRGKNKQKNLLTAQMGVTSDTDKSNALSIVKELLEV